MSLPITMEQIVRAIREYEDQPVYGLQEVADKAGITIDQLFDILDIYHEND